MTDGIRRSLRGSGAIFFVPTVWAIRFFRKLDCPDFLFLYYGHSEGRSPVRIPALPRRGNGILYRVPFNRGIATALRASQ